MIYQRFQATITKATNAKIWKGMIDNQDALKPSILGQEKNSSSVNTCVAEKSLLLPKL
jgi:hypothetical protein